MPQRSQREPVFPESKSGLAAAFALFRPIPTLKKNLYRGDSRHKG